MSRVPIDIMMDRVEWVEMPAPDATSDMPHATHSGALTIAGLPPLRCYRLSNGKAVFHADDFMAAFGELLTGDAP